MPLNEDDLAAFNKCRNAKVALELVQGWQIHPHELCAELHRAGPNIDATLLGECLGHHSPFWKECAAHFACHFDELAGKDIVAALRIYLFHFRLPGESGPIERILEGFAKGYMHFNPRQGVTSPEKIQPSGAASSSSASATLALFTITLYRVAPSKLSILSPTMSSSSDVSLMSSACNLFDLQL